MLTALLIGFSVCGKWREPLPVNQHSFSTVCGILTSLYPGYHPEAGPISIIIGTLYALVAGAIAGGLFGWLYNTFVIDR